MDTAERLFQEKYRAYLRDLILSRTRITAVIAVILVPLFAILDFGTQPQAAWDFLWIRIAVSLAAGLVILMTWHDFGKRRPLLLSLLVPVITSLGIEAMIVRLGAHTTPYYAGECLVTLTAGLILPWKFPVMFGYCLFQLASYILPAQLEAGPFHWQIYVNNLFFFCSTAAVACAASYYGSQTRLREFRLRSNLEKSTEDLTKTSQYLAESLRKVQEFDRLKTQFFANMSHELRTPLTLILPPLEDLLHNPRYSLPGDAKSLLEIMARNGKRLLKLINQLLDLSKLEAGKLELHRSRSNMAKLLEEVVSRFLPYAQNKGLTIETDIPGNAPDAFFDIDRMELVIQNLLSNALKFTPAGGRVTVRLAWDRQGQTLAVEDTGIGIRPEDQGRVFDRFSQADGAITRRFGGTGIGLSLARELAQLHGGRIDVRSEPGKGSCFQVWIPESAAEGGQKPLERHAGEVTVDWELEEEAKGSLDAPVRKNGDRPTILVIDDNSDLRSLLRMTLEPQFHVVLAKDGEEGMAAARRLLPDVVISDVMMPGKSGNEVARELKGDPLTAPIPLILLTAKLDAGALVEGLAAGADDYVRKPFSPVELLARIQGQLRIRQLTRLLLERASQGVLGSLAGGVAHEINNPLGIMNLHLDRLRRILRKHPGAPDEAALGVEKAQSYIKRIARIVESLSALAGAGSKNQVVDIKNMVEDVACMLRSEAARRGVDLSSATLPEGWSVQGDGGALRQALLNLMLNGLEAAARGEGDEKQVLVEARLEAGRVRLEVSDTGPGVPPELRDKIFHPFFTTKPVGAGLGLGLCTAKRIAETHGGDIRLAASPGRTAFIMSLPALNQ